MFRLVIISVLLFLVCACKSTPDWDYDKTVNFSGYKTFAFVNDAGLKVDINNYQINDLMDQRIKNAVIKKLEDMGLNQINTEQADVLINYHASVNKKVESSTINTGYSARWSYWGWGYQSETNTKEYKVGTLIVDVIDRITNQLVWRGAKEGRLKKHQTPEKRESSINTTISEILSNFPPKTER